MSGESSAIASVGAGGGIGRPLSPSRRLGLEEGNVDGASASASATSGLPASSATTVHSPAEVSAGERRGVDGVATVVVPSVSNVSDIFTQGEHFLQNSISKITTELRGLGVSVQLPDSLVICKVDEHGKLATSSSSRQYLKVSGLGDSHGRQSNNTEIRIPLAATGSSNYPDTHHSSKLLKHYLVLASTILDFLEAGKRTQTHDKQLERSESMLLQKIQRVLLPHVLSYIKIALAHIQAVDLPDVSGHQGASAQFESPLQAALHPFGIASFKELTGLALMSDRLFSQYHDLVGSDVYNENFRAVSMSKKGGRRRGSLVTPENPFAEQVMTAFRIKLFPDGTGASHDHIVEEDKASFREVFNLIREHGASFLDRPIGLVWTGGEGVDRERRPFEACQFEGGDTFEDTFEKLVDGFHHIRSQQEKSAQGEEGPDLRAELVWVPTALDALFNLMGHLCLETSRDGSDDRKDIRELFVSVDLDDGSSILKLEDDSSVTDVLVSLYFASEDAQALAEARRVWDHHKSQSGYAASAADSEDATSAVDGEAKVEGKREVELSDGASSKKQDLIRDEKVKLLPLFLHVFPGFVDEIRSCLVLLDDVQWPSTLNKSSLGEARSRFTNIIDLLSNLKLRREESIKFHKNPDYGDHAVAAFLHEVISSTPAYAPVLRVATQLLYQKKESGNQRRAPRFNLVKGLTVFELNKILGEFNAKERVVFLSLLRGLPKFFEKDVDCRTPFMQKFGGKYMTAYNRFIDGLEATIRAIDSQLKLQQPHEGGAATASGTGGEGAEVRPDLTTIVHDANSHYTRAFNQSSGGGFLSIIMSGGKKKKAPSVLPFFGAVSYLIPSTDIAVASREGKVPVENVVLYMRNDTCRIIAGALQTYQQEQSSRTMAVEEQSFRVESPHSKKSFIEAATRSLHDELSRTGPLGDSVGEVALVMSFFDGEHTKDEVCFPFNMPNVLEVARIIKEDPSSDVELNLFQVNDKNLALPLAEKSSSSTPSASGSERRKSVTPAEQSLPLPIWGLVFNVDDISHIWAENQEQFVAGNLFTAISSFITRLERLKEQISEHRGFVQLAEPVQHFFLLQFDILFYRLNQHLEGMRARSDREEAASPSHFHERDTISTQDLLTRVYEVNNALYFSPFRHILSVQDKVIKSLEYELCKEQFIQKKEALIQALSESGNESLKDVVDKFVSTLFKSYEEGGDASLRTVFRDVDLSILNEAFEKLVGFIAELVGELDEDRSTLGQYPTALKMMLARFRLRLFQFKDILHGELASGGRTSASPASSSAYSPMGSMQESSAQPAARDLQPDFVASLPGGGKAGDQGEAAGGAAAASGSSSGSGGDPYTGITASPAALREFGVGPSASQLGDGLEGRSPVDVQLAHLASLIGDNGLPSPSRSSVNELELIRRQLEEGRKKLEADRAAFEQERGAHMEAATTFQGRQRKLAEECRELEQRQDALSKQQAEHRALIEELGPREAALQREERAVAEARKQLEADLAAFAEQQATHQAAVAELGPQQEALQTDRRAVAEAREKLEADQATFAEQQAAHRAAVEELGPQQEALQTDRRAVAEARKQLEADQATFAEQQAAHQAAEAELGPQQTALQAEQRAAAEARKKLEADQATFAEQHATHQAAVAELGPQQAAIQSERSAVEEARQQLTADQAAFAKQQEDHQAAVAELGPQQAALQTEQRAAAEAREKLEADLAAFAEQQATHQAAVEELGPREAALQREQSAAAEARQQLTADQAVFAKQQEDHQNAVTALAAERNAAQEAQQQAQQLQQQAQQTQQQAQQQAQLAAHRLKTLEDRSRALDVREAALAPAGGGDTTPTTVEEARALLARLVEREAEARREAEEAEQKEREARERREAEEKRKREEAERNAREARERAEAEHKAREARERREAEEKRKREEAERNAREARERAEAEHKAREARERREAEEKRKREEAERNAREARERAEAEHKAREARERREAEEKRKREEEAAAATAAAAVSATTPGTGSASTSAPAPSGTGGYDSDDSGYSTDGQGR